MRPATIFALFFFPVSLAPIRAETAMAAPEAVASTVSPSAATLAARESLGAFFARKAGGSPQLPDFPRQKLLPWFEARALKATTEEEKFRFVGESLLVAQSLLASRDEATRKLGLKVAGESANYLGAHLPRETWLLARVYELFLLPRLSLASAEVWRSPSRARILEASVSAFGKAGERDRQIRVLEWILSLDKPQPTSPKPTLSASSLALGANTLDWARGTLATLLFSPPNATRADMEKALHLLQAIESPQMTGFQHLQTQVQKRLTELSPAVSPHATNPIPTP